MKTSILRLTTIILFSVVILSSCKKDDEPQLPIVNITNEAVVTSHSAALSAVVDNNGSTIVSGGFYWSRKPNPTAGDSVLLITVAGNVLSANLEDLPQGESFYYAAFAQNADGIGVSAPKKFTLVQNAPQIVVLINGAEVNGQITLQTGVDALFKIEGSMQVPSELVSLSRLRILYIAYGSQFTLTDQNISGTETEYLTQISFSSTGVLDIIFELFDQYNNVTKKTITVTVE